MIVVDEDLGRSGADATAREGFSILVAEVGLGKVGIVFAIEVSSVARNNADWYLLLSPCRSASRLSAVQQADVGLVCLSVNTNKHVRHGPACQASSN